MTQQFYTVKYREADGQPDLLGLDTFSRVPFKTDPGKMTVRGLLTAEVRDRQGDILLVDGMDLSSHMKNAVVLIDHGKFHNLPIGTCISPETGQYMVEADIDAGEVWFTAHLSQSSHMARQVFELISEGILVGASPGFRPIEVEELPDDPEMGFRASRGPNGERRPAGKLIRRSELCEVSIASVPVNQAAAELACHKSYAGRPLAPALMESFRSLLPVPTVWANGWGDGAAKAWHYTEALILDWKAAKPIGHVSNRADGDYKKVGEGDWQKVTEGGGQQAAPAEETLGGDSGDSGDSGDTAGPRMLSDEEMEALSDEELEAYLAELEGAEGGEAPVEEVDEEEAPEEEEEEPEEEEPEEEDDSELLDQQWEDMAGAYEAGMAEKQAAYEEEQAAWEGAKADAEARYQADYDEWVAEGGEDGLYPEPEESEYLADLPEEPEEPADWLDAAIQSAVKANAPPERAAAFQIDLEREIVRQGHSLDEMEAKDVLAFAQRLREQQQGDTGKAAHSAAKAWSYLPGPTATEEAGYLAAKAWEHVWSEMEWEEKARVRREEGSTWTTQSGNKYTKTGGKIRKVYEGKEKKVGRLADEGEGAEKPPAEGEKPARVQRGGKGDPEKVRGMLEQAAKGEKVEGLGEALLSLTVPQIDSLIKEYGGRMDVKRAERAEVMARQAAEKVKAEVVPEETPEEKPAEEVAPVEAVAEETPQAAPAVNWKDAVQATYERTTPHTINRSLPGGEILVDVRGDPENVRSNYAHEVAHQIHDYKMTNEQRAAWRKIGEEEKAKGYIHRSVSGDPEEDFPEAFSAWVSGDPWQYEGDPVEGKPWTPKQGGLPPAYREFMLATFGPPEQIELPPQLQGTPEPDLTVKRDKTGRRVQQEQPPPPEPAPQDAPAEATPEEAPPPPEQPPARQPPPAPAPQRAAQAEKARAMLEARRAKAKPAEAKEDVSTSRMGASAKPAGPHAAVPSELAGQGTPLEKIQRLHKASIDPRLTHENVGAFVEEAAAGLSGAELKELAKGLFVKPDMPRAAILDAITNKIAAGYANYRRGLEGTDPAALREIDARAEAMGANPFGSRRARGEGVQSQFQQQQAARQAAKEKPAAQKPKKEAAPLSRAAAGAVSTASRLLSQSLDPNLTRDKVEAQLRPLETSLSRDDMQALARELNIKGGNNKAVIDALVKRILAQRHEYERGLE